MARYVDVDALIAEYDRAHIGAPGGARKLMVDAPTADVAPRAELAREIFKEIETLKRSCIKTELFKGGWFEMRAFEDGLSALKKKYMEPEPPKS